MSLRVAFWSPHGWPSPNTHHVPVRRAEILESFSGRRCQEPLLPEWQGKDGLVTHKDWLAYAHKQAAGHHVTHQPHVRARVSNTCLKSSQTRGWPPPDTMPLQGARKMTKCPLEAVHSLTQIGSFGHQQMWKGRNLLGWESRET